MEHPDTKCGGKLLNSTFEPFESRLNSTLKLRHIEQLEKGINPCFNTCLAWDEHLEYQYKNTDNMCCELEMTLDTSRCNLYFEGDKNDTIKLAEELTEEDLKNSNTKFRAATF